MAGTYNSWMVLLSVLVAIFASYTALNLATRITASRGYSARVWLIGGAVSMGTGIWAMHFIGMLAFSLPIRMGYDVAVTILSMGIAIVVSGFALFIVSRSTLSWRRLLLSGVLMGTGICAMHYTGMAAMKMSPSIKYDLTIFSASIAIAVVASCVALWIAFTLRTDTSWMKYAKLGSSVIMGFAITGMHYTGMAAAQFAPNSMCLTGTFVDNSWMAGTITGITALILCTTLGISVMDARMESRTAKMVTSLQSANDELQRIALLDPLTKLPNRLLLEDRISQAISYCQRNRHMCAVLFVDIDRFKTVNDSLGHYVGDELLRAVGESLRLLIREEDTVSRLGGDEFVIMLGEILQPENAAAVAQKVIESLGHAFRVHAHELYVTASVGIVLYPENGDTAQALITMADAAMYSAKNSGRNNFQFFTAEMNTFFPERLALENDLRHALERREFELHYQPKVDIQKNQVVGMEALLRWRHPEKGLLPPNEFIPLAEETGLIIPIGRWVIEEACAQNKAWQDKGLPKPRVAVNISGVQFRQKDLLASINQALANSGMAPRFLEVEITESVVMQNASETIITLEHLRRAGVHIAIDDFGTGYSSLSYLKRFPMNTLKIDRSFIQDVSEDMDDAAIVRSIIGLAHNLRLNVVAEGVETKQQLQLLHSLGAAEYQGYYMSKPLPATEFERYLQTNRNDAWPLTPVPA